MFEQACRKLDTESLGTLRVLGLVVVCVVVRMRVQPARDTDTHEFARIAARVQHKRNGNK